jgi:argininosuccinate lyase
MALLPVLANAVRGLTVNGSRLEAAIDSTMMATDLADYLVEKEIPFREAHCITGQVVRLGLKLDKDLDDLSLGDFQSIYPGFDRFVYQVFGARYSVSRRKAYGGTGPEAVQNQIKICREALT